MFYLLVVINLALLGFSYKLTLGRVNREFSGSILHPLTFFILLNAFFTIDFVLLWSNPEFLGLISSEVNVFGIKKDITVAYAIYVYILMCGFLGIFFGYWWFRNIKLNEFVGRARCAASLLVSRLLFAIILLSAGFASLFLYSQLGGGAARQDLFERNIWAIIPFFFLMPALLLYLANRFKRFSLTRFCVLIAMCAILFYSTGTRSHIIFLGLVFFTFLHLVGFRVSNVFILLVAPIAVIFLVAERYLRRYSGDAVDMLSFIEQSDGIVALLFFTGEISMAEVITLIIKYLDSLKLYPFESFVGFILVPIPRSLIPFKPEGAGYTFTEMFAPLRLAASNSQITATGFGDLIMQFGFVASGLVFFVMCFLWVAMFVRILNQGIYYKIIFLPYLAWLPFLFLRAGIFDMGVAFWYAFVFYSLYRILIEFFHGLIQRVEDDSTHKIW